MKSVRQDAWTTEEDALLAKIILRNIREGGTQLLAFQEAGVQMGRTGAACGYRWNAILRKQQAAEIELAKAERRARREAGGLPEPGRHTRLSVDADEDVATDEGGELSWSSVLRFLRGQKAESQVLAARLGQLELELTARMAEAGRLAAENQALREEAERLHEELEVIRRDYRALVQIMERARQLSYLAEPDE